MLIVYFFFIDTASTEIYTYLHTLSLHDALPIFFEDFIGMVPMGRQLFGGLNPVHTGGPMQVSIAFAEAHAQDYPYEVEDSRSEEHTSELQSLMRISYAVFCLKKKKKTINRNQIEI